MGRDMGSNEGRVSKLNCYDLCLLCMAIGVTGIEFTFAVVYWHSIDIGHLHHAC